VSASIRAILLVAGVGRRLGAQHPKSLLEFGGKSLLQRHVDALATIGASSLTIVVGHLEDQIRAVVARMTTKLPIEFRTNEHFREGSVVSLWTARDALSSTEATLVMDGDVLYPPSLLARLRDGGGESALLVDRRSEETGEEMMVGVRGGRAWTIARRVGKGDADGPWDQVGESVGFLKVGASHAAPLRAALEAHVAAGHRNTEYEAVYATFMRTHPIGIVDVGDAPWTEIDFEEDVAKARDLVLPAIGG
jgi:choline kinase